MNIMVTCPCDALPINIYIFKLFDVGQKHQLRSNVLKQ